MEDVMCITPLGSGQEVGRSCHIIEFRDVKIMCDIGIHPGYDGLNGLPYLDRIELQTVDILLVSHFHLDHAASLPYLTERTNFRGRIYMTHPTKAVTRLLLGDYIRLLQMKQQGSDGDAQNDMLYTEKELQSCLNKVECIDYHTVITIPNKGCSFYALNAGHVLGACMFYIDIGGRTVLYTGDYSMEDDRHLMAAELPFSLSSSSSTNQTMLSSSFINSTTDVLICESTYGVQVHASRAEREARFTTTVERIVTRGGRCLIPVFALGRAQELLLILDEYWQANPQLQNIPIWYASKLASRALRVYQTYSNMMNIRIRAQMDISNPFHFNFIQNLKSINVQNFDDSGPSVVFASPGMLQSGVSRQLFDRWASDPKNGVIIAGYAVEHTLAKEIMAQPKEVVTLEGRKQPLNCLVDYVSFSAHVDFVQNRSFITKVAPKHIVLVHGQKDEMGRLKSALMLQYKSYPENKRPTITMPPNQVEVKLKFPRRRSAKVMGKLAEDRVNNEPPQEGETVRGILVTQNFHSKIVASSDVATYTPLRVGTISSKLHVPFAGSLDMLQMFLHELFANIVEQPIDVDTSNQPLEADGTNPQTTPIMYMLHGGEVRVIMGLNKRSVVVEWEASPAGDVVADSVVALIMHAQSSAASIRYTSKPCRHPRDDTPLDEEEKKRLKSDDLVYNRLRFIRAILREQFQNVEAVYEAYKGTYEIVTDAGIESGVLDSDGKLKFQVIVEFDDAFASTAKITVECPDQKIASNIQTTLQNAIVASASVRTKGF